MKKIFLMQPRQSGKTAKAIYEFMKDPCNTLFVTSKVELAKEIQKKIGSHPNNFISCNQFKNRLIGNKTPKNIILDEYMFFKNRDEIYNIINTIQPENVYVFSTSDRYYDKRLFKFVKENKKTRSYESLLRKYKLSLKKYGIKLTENISKHIYDLYYNFLTDDDTIIIDSNFSSYLNEVNENNLINILGVNQYNIEIKNRYLV